MEPTFIIFWTDPDFPDLTPQAALFGFISESDNNLNILQNRILSIFKLHIYQLSERGVLNLNDLIKNVVKVKKLKRKIEEGRSFSLITNGNKQILKLLFNLKMYLLRNCFYLSFFLLLSFFCRGGRGEGESGGYLFILFYFNFISKLFRFYCT